MDGRRSFDYWLSYNFYGLKNIICFGNGITNIETDNSPDNEAGNIDHADFDFYNHLSILKWSLREYLIRYIYF